MGAVAVAMKEQGYIVTGSDAGVYPPMSDFLFGKGIPISSPYAADNIPTDTDLVVVGNALGRGNVELEAVLNRTFAAYRELIEHA